MRSNIERKWVCNRTVPHLQQEFVPARTRSRKSPTRVLLCRLGPLVWSRPRCRTTVPQLVSRPDQRPRTAPASHTTRPPTARTPIYVPLRARGTWVWFIRQRCRSRGTIAQQRPTKGTNNQSGAHAASCARKTGHSPASGCESRLPPQHPCRQVA